MAAFPNTRALFKKREKLEALIEFAIDCLDSIDGDCEAEASIGFDEPEFDDGENDADVICEDEFLCSYKVLSRGEANGIRRKARERLDLIQQERTAQ